jgi:L-serine dehydratase
MAESAGLAIADLQGENERSLRSDDEISEGIDRIWGVMQECVERGLRSEGELRVRRRAPDLYAKICERQGHSVQGMDWVNLFALAVNEENAAGGRVVTAPTNGAAGIIPAVLHYYDRFVPGATLKGIEAFFLAAAAIGALIKRNASISGAEVGCQGEVGSASAMAAGGLASALGASNAQVENAAECAGRVSGASCAAPAALIVETHAGLPRAATRGMICRAWGRFWPKTVKQMTGSTPHADPPWLA